MARFDRDVGDGEIEHEFSTYIIVEEVGSKPLTSGCIRHEER